MKHLFSIICLIAIYAWIAPFSSVRAEGSESYCQEFAGFELYECRKESLCDPYLPKTPIYAAELYNEVAPVNAGNINDSPLNIAKRNYRKNMENIYKCGMLKVQKKTLENIESTFKYEQSGQLDGIIGSQIDTRIMRIDLSANRLKCSFSSENQINSKLEILWETSHQMCQYVSYLEYLKEHYSDTRNVLHELPQSDSDSFWISVIPGKINAIQAEISAEISHTYRVYPMAYKAFVQYESNYPIHFLLEVIRADFLILRKTMYETLMPIAQLGIKVINAMSY